jgi:hypothetical protein
MPQFKVDGADPGTGATRIVILTANDVADAEKSAKKMGLIVRHVQPYAGEFPTPPTMPAGPVTYQIAPIGQSFHNPRWLTEVTFPMLVSAIANIVFSLFWAPGNLGFCFAIALTAVAVCEFRLIGEAGRMPADVLLNKAKKISYYEIGLGILTFGVSIACGIVALNNCRKFLASGAKQEVADGTPVQIAKQYVDSVIASIKGFRKK